MFFSIIDPNAHTVFHFRLQLSSESHPVVFTAKGFERISLWIRVRTRVRKYNRPPVQRTRKHAVVIDHILRYDFGTLRTSVPWPRFIACRIIGISVIKISLLN